MSCRFRLCTLKRRIRLSPELSRSAPTALHLQDESRIPHLTTFTGALLLRWEPRNTQGLPIHNSVNSRACHDSIRNRVGSILSESRIVYPNRFRASLSRVRRRQVGSQECSRQRATARASLHFSRGKAEERGFTARKCRCAE